MARSRKAEAARQARLKREARRRRRTIALVVGVAAVAVAVVVVTQRSDNEARKKLEATLTAGDCTLDGNSDRGGEHVTNPTYQVDPPAGGDHLAQAASAGTYDTGQVPADGSLVHAMEHGFIVIWYQPDISEDDLDTLLTIADEHGDSTLVVPRASMRTPVAATAWHKRLLCPSVEQSTLEVFVEGFRNKGPEKGFM